jgi:hypothetical protein
MRLENIIHIVFYLKIKCINTSLHSSYLKIFYSKWNIGHTQKNENLKNMLIPLLRRIFGPKRDEVGENYIMRSFIICTLLQV